MIKLKRVYDEPAAGDGYRVLVDRLWPRGLSKEKAALDEWLKEVAPSDELRTWFHHDPALFKEFTERYRQELRANPAATELRRLAQDKRDITLLYAAHDPNHNNAVVLRSFLQND